MGIIGLGNETYLYVNGIVVNREIVLYDHVTLLPVSAELDSNVASKLIEKNVDYFIAALSSGNLNAQIKIEAESAKELAVEAWNSQWDCLLLGAIINNSVMCNLQCDKPVELINEASYLNVTNYELRGTRGISKELTTEDETWIEKHYKKARELLDHQRYNTAVHCMATYTWHSLPNVQLAILWSGIESLFNVSTEVGFRVSLYISNYLSNNHEEAKSLFSHIKDIYNARSSAVHGSNRKLKKPIDEYVNNSADILNRLIRKCAENNALPDIESLVF